MIFKTRSIAIKTGLYCCLAVIVLGCFSCSHRIHSATGRSTKAYYSTLKMVRAQYTDYAPLNLVSDSLRYTTLLEPSPNFGARTPNLVILHHTAQNSCLQALKTLTNDKAAGRVSSHYLVCKDGTVYQLVNDLFRSWHAGIAKWGTITDVNSVSLGIEIDNNGLEPFSDTQIHSLLLLLGHLKSKYKIPTGHFIGHADIAPARKQDPSQLFPWQQLADNGFGYWYDPVLTDPPIEFDPVVALKLIGYDTSNLPAAIIAFKRHFIQHDLSAQLTEEDKKVLYNLVQKYNH